MLLLGNGACRPRLCYPRLSIRTAARSDRSGPWRHRDLRLLRGLDVHRGRPPIEPWMRPGELADETGDRGRIEAGVPIHAGGRILGLEPVGQRQAADPEAPIQKTLACHPLQDMGAEATHRPVLDGDERFMVPGQLPDQCRVQRLGETGIGDRDRQALTRQHLGGYQAFGQSGSERENGHVRALAHDPALADGERHPRAGMSTPTPSPRG